MLMNMTTDKMLFLKHVVKALFQIENINPIQNFLSKP